MLKDEFPPDPHALFSAIRFVGRSAVVAAVSGGGDSLALLLLLHDFLKHLPGAPSVLAVTIDHGLRPESGAEAEAVGRLAAAHGLPHRVLRWEGPKPKTGIAAAARAARLSLLAKAAGQAGADLVLTGHTADDQAETLAMRLARGEGRGAAGIAPATLYDGRIWFVRPLLGTRRAALRTFLRERGISWAEDPTNIDRRFERARVRQDLGEQRARALIAAAGEAAAAREKAGEAAAELIARSSRKAVPGLIHVRPEALQGSRQGVYALRILLAIAGGTPHLPDEARSARLLARAGEEGLRATLSRAVLSGGRQGLYLHRERRNLPECRLGNGIIWDGRYRIDAEVQPADLVIGPLGAQNAQEMDIEGAQWPAGLVRAALAAEPALWEAGRCLGLAASMPGVSIRPVAAPWAMFLPSFDLAPASAATALLGGEQLPASPWRGHKEM